MRVDSLTIWHHKKQIDVSFSCVCPVIDSEFCHNIVKVVCGSTLLSPCGSTLLNNLYTLSFSRGGLLTDLIG